MKKRVLAGAALALGVMADVRDATACGGCFHPTAEQGVSVITDHRMVLKVSPAETILWDQVQYSGSPREFAWVLPVHAGAKIELSRDEWIAALDAATQATVLGPDVTCASTFTPSQGSSQTSSGATTPSSGGGGGGCASGTSDSASVPIPHTSAETPPPPPSDGTSFLGNTDVSVTAQSVIGPYQAVTIHSTDGKGVGPWLTENGFAIPANVQPIIDAYTSGGFDFIALRLRPDASVRAMRPVRVVTPGADATMPLRMVAAGAGAHVGLTLWVISEGRYHAQNFSDAPLDWAQLKWIGAENRSNLRDLTADALASNGGRVWLTEAAMKSSTTAPASFGPNPSLYDAYTQQCLYRGSRSEPCDPTALPPADGAPDGGADAGDDASADDAGADGGAADAGATQTCTKVVSGCDGYDDLDVATRDLHPSDIWVTRLRADLPVTALDVDLRLEATSEQKALSPAHKTTQFTDPRFSPCPQGTTSSSGGSRSSPSSAPEESGCTCRTSGLRDDLGSAFVIAIGALGASLVTRRRRRRG